MPAGAKSASDHLEALEARVAIASDDQMVVHDNAEGLGDVDDVLRHANVGGRGRRIAGGMVMRQYTRSIILVVFQ